jgi:hypothetical protein
MTPNKLAVEAAAIVRLNIDEGLQNDDKYGVQIIAALQEPHFGDCPFVEKTHPSTCNRCLAEQAVLEMNCILGTYHASLIAQGLQRGGSGFAYDKDREWGARTARKPNDDFKCIIIRTDDEVQG